MGARIQPRYTAPHFLDVEIARAEIPPVQIRDLQFAALRRSKVGRQIGDSIVIKVQSGYCVRRLGLNRFFFKANRSTGGVEFHYAVAFRVFDPIAKNRSSVVTGGCLMQQLGQSVAVKNIVAECQRDICATCKLPGYEECLGYSLWFGLYRVFESDPPVRTVSEETLEGLLLVRRIYDQNVAYPRHHQRGEGIVDHWFVIDRRELLRNRSRHRIEPGSGTSSQYDALPQRPYVVIAMRLWLGFDVQTHESVLLIVIDSTKGLSFLGASDR